MDDTTKELRKILKCNAIVSVSESIINTPVLRASIANKLLDNVEKLVMEWHTKQLNKAGLEARINEWDNFLKFELSANGRIATLKQQLKDKETKNV
jgi:hypothetical protein